MPYERDDIEFHQGMSITGRVSKWGCRYLPDPPRYEYDLLLPSQERSGDTRKMLSVRVTSYGEENSPGSNDYVRATGLPAVKNNRLALMVFAKDVEILNKWVSKGKKHA